MTIVDLGSGKGRVLLLAAQAGFQKVKGVEFSSRLCEIARGNVERFIRSTGSAAIVEIVNEDVATYQVRADETVFFMYNPFGPFVIDAFLQNLRASLLYAPREVWLIYCTPKHDQMISACGVFDTVDSYEFGGTEFRVHHSKQCGVSARQVAG
jgi:cyclopropane fatty-acyl-phospholipid synthase-like methyltransferase